MHGGNHSGSGSGKKHELFSRVTQPIHNSSHTSEPHTTHTTPNMDMDKEIESIDNQSEEAAVAAAAAAASIMMGLIEQEAEDEDCAGSNGEEEEEEQEPKAKQRRRSYPRPKYMESAWGQWLRKLEELHSSEGGLDEDCREARQFVVAFRVPYPMFLGIVEAVAPAFPAAAHDVAGRECIPVELKVRLVFMALSVRCIMACACRPVR